MNRSKIIIAALLVILVLLGASSWPMFVSTANFSYANADKYTAGNAEVSSNTVKALDVDWVEGHVIVKYFSGPGISVSETSPKDLREEDRLRWWMDGSTLRVRYAKPGIRLSYDLDKTLTILLPVIDLDSAEFRSTSADLEINHLIADEMLLKTTSGSINATTVTKKLTADSTSGDMVISQNKEMDSVSLTATSGNITFTNSSSAKTVFAKAVSGDIRMELDEADTVQVETTSGRIDMDGCGDYTRLRSTSGNITHYAYNEGTVEISTNSGNVDADLPKLGSLKINTTSGDVVAMLNTETFGFDCTVSTTSGIVSAVDPDKQDGNTYSWNISPWEKHAYVTTTSGDIRIGRTFPRTH